MITFAAFKTNEDLQGNLVSVKSRGSHPTGNHSHHSSFPELNRQLFQTFEDQGIRQK